MAVLGQDWPPGLHLCPGGSPGGVTWKGGHLEGQVGAGLSGHPEAGLFCQGALPLQKAGGTEPLLSLSPVFPGPRNIPSQSPVLWPLLLVRSCFGAL